MEDDFKFPTANNMEEDEMDVPEDEPVNPNPKVGEEKEIGKNRLRKSWLRRVKDGKLPPMVMRLKCIILELCLMEPSSIPAGIGALRLSSNLANVNSFSY
ncbi:hypothetical protein DITRI_Ditri15bG0045000 [Diplodiscus trichospermus]